MTEHCPHQSILIHPAFASTDFSVSEWVETSDPKLSNYARACPPTSQLRRSERNETVPDFSVASGVRSFIHDHTAAMDLCQHPEHRQLHGFTAGEGVGLGPIVPLFTFAKMQMHTDVLITPLEQYSDTYIGFDPPWNEKTKNKFAPFYFAHRPSIADSRPQAALARLNDRCSLRGRPPMETIPAGAAPLPHARP